MKLFVSFSELEDYILRHTGRSISLSCKDPHTAGVSVAGIHAFRITIDGVVGTRLFFSIGSNALVRLLLRSTVNRMRNTLHRFGIANIAGTSYQFDMASIPHLTKLLATVELQCVAVYADGIQAEAALV